MLDLPRYQYPTTHQLTICRWTLTIAIIITYPYARLLAETHAGIEYARDVRSILSRNCYACHGPDEGSRESGLRLDRADSVLAKSDNGTAIILPGDPDGSELVRRITTQIDDERMPPTQSGHFLSSAEIDKLRRWIEDGAKFDDHWSFRPIVRPALPHALRFDWPANAIDRFILSSLEGRKIDVSPDASRSTLIRRLSFDLIGLPPTPDEVDAFVRDQRFDAYEQLVERLLSSPHFGERWGRHWLDLAHYADSDGYLGDALRPSAWLYRDWVIEAINQDMPFDQFTIEQLAGDLLAGASMAQKTATGFLRNTLRNTEAGVDLEEYRLKEIVDRVSTIGVGWLGLSLGCAECHSHKYDPISQQEFYNLLAFFNDADDVDIPIQVQEEQERYQRLNAIWEKENDALRKAVNRAVTDAEQEGRTFDADVWFVAVATSVKKRTKEQRDFLEKAKTASAEKLRLACEAYEKHMAKKPPAPSTKVMSVKARESSRETYIHIRGDYRNRGKVAKPGTPACLPPLHSRTAPADRLDFARWLVDKANPLTARVVVNQIWSHLFGRGLVASIDNFGAGGELASHPALLDWLASEFVEGGWSRKSLLRRIVCSSTYRQSSILRQDLEALDPSNELLARQSRLRLEAEVIRDLALGSSNLLERRIGGAGIRPPQPAYITAISRNAEWNVTTGGELYRRGMYIVFRRATPYPMLMTFDAPESTIACTRRERSNSPLQALTLLNDPVFFECAQALGYQLTLLEAKDCDDRIRECFRCCIGRNANDRELERIRKAYDELYAKLSVDRSAAEAILPKHARPRSERIGNSEQVDVAEAATWVLVARIVMNIDEFITRE